MRTARLIHGHALDALASLPEASVQCCVTSPPYWGLRDYKLPPQIWDSAEGCAHEWAEEAVATEVGRGNWTQGVNGRGEPQTGGVDAKREPLRALAVRGTCRLCGAWRGSLGLEPTVELYVAHLVQVFRGVWRVLRDDGTLWLNLGDSYAASATSNHGRGKARPAANGRGEDQAPNGWENPPRVAPPPGLKPKDLIGVPWRVALALQDDGWYLRSEIIWAKSAPMPESVRDRPTRAHEHIFLLSKSERYYYDADAVREPDKGLDHPRSVLEGQPSLYPSGGTMARHRGIRTVNGRDGAGRNMRTVWEIGPEPCLDAHFATFPSEIPRRAILAGTSAAGCCGACGAPWARVSERTGHVNRREAAHQPGNSATKTDSTGWAPLTRPTNRWRPTCGCGADAAPCIVLDSFMGSGRTGVTALELGRSFVGIDLSETYLETIARPAIEAALQAHIGEEVPPTLEVARQEVLFI